MDSFSKSQSKKTRILIALFDKSHAPQVTQQLDEHGCECVCATRLNGNPFKFKERLDHFDGVLVNLTGLSEEGEQVVSGWAQQLPVAGWMATHDTNISRVVRALKLGAFDVFHGELDPVNAESMVSELLSRRLEVAACASPSTAAESFSPYQSDSDTEYGESDTAFYSGASVSEEKSPPRVNGSAAQATQSLAARPVNGFSDQRANSLRMYLRGSSSAMESVRRQVLEVATTRATVMIWGKSGTGKELVARAIHRYSSRSENPYLPVNMSAIPDGLAESLLFGHIKGSFTHATQTKEGLCETADNGTLFLDEISEMEISLQPKLLRFLQEGTVRRVGAQDEKQVDVRIIAASNHDAESVIRDGKLRSDLFYRLNVVPIYLPPLCERFEDIPELAELFLSRAVAMHNRTARGFTDEAMKVLTEYDWPGNIRQLENAVERIAIFAKGNFVEPMDIPAEFHSPSSTPSAASVAMRQSNGHTVHEPSEEESHTPTPAARPQLSEVQQFERAAIIDALQRADGHVVDAANLVGLGQATLYRKIKQYDIPHQRHRRRKTPK